MCFFGGLAHIRNERTAFVWANGFISPLQANAGREVRRGLLVVVWRWNAEVSTVLALRVTGDHRTAFGCPFISSAARQRS
jgi:hypothetical protein